MKRHEEADRMLSQALGLFRPSDEHLESIRQRCLEQLERKAGASIETESTGMHSRGYRWTKLWPAFAMMSAIVVAVIAPFLFLNRAPAVLVSMNGTRKIRYGEAVRSSDSNGAVVTLRDGSRVEMRAKSEMSLERASDGVRIRLTYGSVIVNAAHQRDGHLYVQTPNVTVSVVGTVFLVESAAAGSRVAVIEGEVHVQEEGKSRKLLPGDQVATPPPLKPVVPLTEEFSWSQNAREHVALLQQTPAGAAASVRPEFSTESIKPNDPANPVPGLPGFGCNGVDGIARGPFAEGRVALVVPRGRCVGNRVGLPSLIEFAYGIPQRYATGAPDWASVGARTNVELAPGRVVPMLVQASFQIEALADDPSAVTTDQMRLMVQSMLSNRFKLRTHREVQEVPGYVLQVSKNGLKLQEASGDETPLAVDYSVLGMPVLRGKASLAEFRRFIMGFSNPTGFVNLDLSSYVIDRTGLTGIYDFALAMPVPGGGGTRSESSGPPQYALDDPRSASERYNWRGPALAEAVEKQLGIRMQAQKVPVEVLVIDQVERPSPN
jgi:uncharacterized protein (TIGR03435 family)